MGLRRRTAVPFVLFCYSLLAASEAGQGPASCPEGWRLFEDSCYRRTASPLRQNQLTNTCQQMGGAAVSIHSSQENDFVANVAGGNYIWLGMRLTGPNKHTWVDGTSYNYAKFLPPGNSMLKSKSVGAGIFQQSCRRWNYETSGSRLLYGVCKTAASRCPSGALERSGYCYFVSSQPVPWWDAHMACFETNQHGLPADVGLQDWELSLAVTGHFGGTTELLVQVERGEDALSQETCSWNTLQYGQRTSHRCDYGCAELHGVLCRRPKIVGTNSAAGAGEPLRMMPPMYKGGSGMEVRPVSECPSGWRSRGKRCVSGPIPAASRVLAEARCQDEYSSRLTTIREDSNRVILALQLDGVSEAWVRDERPPGARFSRYSFNQQRQHGGVAAALVQPGYSVLTADGLVISKPAEVVLPALCEYCQLSCGPGAMAFAGHCYRLLEKERTLNNASSTCAAFGGALVSIDSEPENRFVSALVFPSASAQCSEPHKEAWLGLRRRTISYSWEWEDCSEYSTEFWAPDAGNTGRCASLLPDGLWRDRDRCDQVRLLAVCEWDPCEPREYRGSCQELLKPGSIY